MWEICLHTHKTTKSRKNKTKTKTIHSSVRERENSNSKTLIVKDSSVRSTDWDLTASPCYTTNTTLQTQTNTTIPFILFL